MIAPVHCRACVRAAYAPTYFYSLQPRTLGIFLWECRDRRCVLETLRAYRHSKLISKSPVLEYAPIPKVIFFSQQHMAYELLLVDTVVG
jgi:hypothetical protein